MLIPRSQHRDLVIDCAESLVASSGLDALTMRALTRATGFSNGAIYRTFGSRGALVGRMWIRAESRFLELLKDLIAQAQNPFDAVVAGAEASLAYRQQYPKSAAVLFSARRAEIVSQPMPAEVGVQLRALQQELTGIMSRLAMDLWGRCDAGTLDLVAVCLMELPKWIALRHSRFGAPLVGEYLRAAIRAMLAVGPPPLAPAEERRCAGSGVVHASALVFGHHRGRDRAAQPA